MVLVRIVLGLCGIAAMALFMWGLRSFIYAVSEEFAFGVVTGMGLLLALQIAAKWADGERVFTSGSSRQRLPEVD